MTKTISINQFRVKIYDTRAEMGFCAADEAAAAIRGVLAQKEECNMIFAAAPRRTRCWPRLRRSRALNGTV